jgi:hypothetical protein
MPTVGFEPTIPASERPQAHILYRAAPWDYEAYYYFYYYYYYYY